MPSRGAPWRGVGKGQQDRIGTGEVKDDSLLSEDIKDGTIAEVDLNSALQAKVNQAGGHVIEDEGTPLSQRPNMNFIGAGVTASDDGETTNVTIPGGGGGVFDFENNSLLEEDFIAFDATFFENNKYQSLAGTIGLSGSDDQNGAVRISPSDANAGSHGMLHSGPYGSGGFQVQYKGGGFAQNMDALWIQQSVSSLTDVMMFHMLANGDPGTGSTDKDNVFGTRRLIGFYYDSGEDGFWHIFSSLGATTTELATTVTVKTSRQALRIAYTTSNDTATYFIDGVQVGTINTNIADFELTIGSYIWNTNTVLKQMSVDAWRLTSPRRFP